MTIAPLMCCANIDSSNEWLGPASTVVVALVGLCSGVIIAKLSSHLELMKTLCLRKVEVYEAAMRQLVLKINLYANFLNTLRGAVDSSTLEMRLGLMAAVLAQLPQVEQNDADVARLLFYTDLPSYDNLPLMSEIPRFLETVKRIVQKTQGQLTSDERIDLAKKLNEAVARFGPLAETEYNQQQAIFAKLKKDIALDRQLRKLLRADE